MSDTPHPDLSQLPFLIRLVDDPSPAVRDKVTRVLRTYGPQLSSHIQALELTLSPQQKAALRRLVTADEASIRSAWTNWVNSSHRTQISEHQKLETALELLARWQSERNENGERAPRLRTLLDKIAEDFLDRDGTPDPEELSQFLFGDLESGSKGIAGAPADDYYNPLNSNLVWAIENGQGLPITLACIFMLVGDRVDLKIHGCSFPGHFLTRVREDGQDWLFDPFNGGRMLSANEVAALRKVAPRELSEPPSAVTIVTRVLHNMVNAYRQSDDEAHLAFVLELLNDLHSAQSNTPTL
ncbi:MAG: hypothetical protein JWN98_1259 [Abditibacteriota bacterium]|nr:hypothetical protein [Abditibacteriota bacterium]